MNSNATVLQYLTQLNLEADEAAVYVELLAGPSTHVKLSRATNINRSKVYRIIDHLEKMSLVAKRTDDKGSFVEATDPTTLEVALIAEEEALKRKRIALEESLPLLASLQSTSDQPFVVHTYEGLEGMKHMVWHELKAKHELLVMGNGRTEQLIPDERWSQRHRDLYFMKANYTVRSLLNEHDPIAVSIHTNHAPERYQFRYISPKIFNMYIQTTIYNDVVATYQWRQDKKVGVEIICKEYAAMMRQIFESYWRMAQ